VGWGVEFRALQWIAAFGTHMLVTLKEDSALKKPVVCGKNQ
jgi:hypothetical protein